MVLAPQRIPTNPSRRFSIGRDFTTVGAILTCSRRGAKKHRRRRDSPKAHSLARALVLAVAWRMANSFRQGRPPLVDPAIEDTPLREFAHQALPHGGFTPVFALKTDSWERGKLPQDPPETVEDQLVASCTRAAKAASWARSTRCGTRSFKDPVPSWFPYDHHLP